jgi:hypothetical protein
MIRRTYPQAAMTRLTGPRQRYPLDTHDKNHTNKNSITLSNDPPGGDGDARSHSTARGTTGHHFVMLCCVAVHCWYLLFGLDARKVRGSAPFTAPRVHHARTTAMMLGIIGMELLLRCLIITGSPIMTSSNIRIMRMTPLLVVLLVLRTWS